MCTKFQIDLTTNHTKTKIYPTEKKLQVYLIREKLIIRRTDAYTEKHNDTPVEDEIKNLISITIQLTDLTHMFRLICQERKFKTGHLSLHCRIRLAC